MVVTGTNFGPTEPVLLYWDRFGATPLTGVRTSATGTFTAHLTAPPASAGLHGLIAVGVTSRRHAVAPERVKPATSLRTAQGLPASTDVLSGVGFGKSETVRAYLAPGHIPLGSARTNGVGTFAGPTGITFTVPLSATGSYWVYSVGASSRAVALSHVTLGTPPPTATASAIATPTSTVGATAITQPLRVLASNTHYFTDGSGQAILLSGSHTWNDFQDTSQSSSPAPFDFAAYVSFLHAHGHNMTILWKKDLPTYCNWGAGGTWHMSPFPWPRSGPGAASDGLPPFDLSQFNQAYFDRLRARVLTLLQHNIYATVELFDGLGLLNNRCANDGYPFSAGNNVNGVDDGGGTGLHDHDRAQRHHADPGRLRAQGHRHAQRPAQRAVGGLRGGAEQLDLVAESHDRLDPQL